EDDLARRGAQLLLERRGLLHERGVRKRGRRQRERCEPRDDERALHRCGTPANWEKCPSTGAVSRSQYRNTAMTRNVVAKPVAATIDRGRNACSIGNTDATMSVHPSAWWRNAARAKNQGFCSCTRNAVPDTSIAAADVSRQYCEWSLPCATPSSAAPASISICAHEPWATMWIIEFVYSAITGHMQTP